MFLCFNWTITYLKLKKLKISARQADKETCLRTEHTSLQCYILYILISVTSHTSRSSLQFRHSTGCPLVLLTVYCWRGLGPPLVCVCEVLSLLLSDSTQKSQEAISFSPSHTHRNRHTPTPWPLAHIVVTHSQPAAIGSEMRPINSDIYLNVSCKKICLSDGLHFFFRDMIINLVLISGIKTHQHSC